MNQYFKRSNNPSLDKVIAYSTAILYVPQFIGYAHLLFEQILCVTITFLLLNDFLKNNKPIPRSAFGCAVTYLIIFSIDLARSFDFAIYKDSFELIKPITFLMFFYLGYSSCLSQSDMIKYIKWLTTNFIIIAILGLLEANTDTFNSIFASLYKGFRGAVSHKAVFSFISPYCLATIFTIPFFFFFFLIFTTPFYKKNILLCFLFVTVIVFTQSKTVFLGIILTFLITLLIVYRCKWIIGRKNLLQKNLIVVTAIIFLLPILTIFFQEKFSYLYIGLKVFFDSIANSSNITEIMRAQPTTQHRFDQLLFAIKEQDFIPLIGVAIGKAVLYPESFYAMYLYRTGLVGIIMHFAILFFAAAKAIRISKYYAINYNPILYSFYLSLFIFIISLFFCYFSAAVTDQTRVAFVLYFFIGHLHSVKLKTNFL